MLFRSIKVSIQISDMEVASMQTVITFDPDVLEYVSGPENSNKVDDRVIYVWYDENGGLSPKTGGEVATFIWRAKKEGESMLKLDGQFWGTDTSEIAVHKEDISISVLPFTSEEQDSTYLQILRLNEEGITPYFEKNVTEYYFVADATIDSLEVTAIPKNSNAKVTITGNDNLKMGTNVIQIKVSLNGKDTIYKIHVTKTGNKQMANTNLEILAVENAMLYPSFDNNVTNYQIEIGNEQESLKVLAIPENIKSTVEVQGNEKLIIGDNLINVTVKAEDGITTKKYFIHVHRRNLQEEQEYKEEQERQIEMLSSIFEEQNDEKQEDLQELQKNSNNNFLWIIILFAFLIITVCIIFLKRKRFI